MLVNLRKKNTRLMQCVIYYDYCNVIIIFLSLSCSVTASAKHVLKRFLFKAISLFFFAEIVGWQRDFFCEDLITGFRMECVHEDCNNLQFFSSPKCPPTILSSQAKRHLLQANNLSKKVYFRFLIERIASLIKVRSINVRENEELWLI